MGDKKNRNNQTKKTNQIKTIKTAEDPYLYIYFSPAECFFLYPRD